MRTRRGQPLIILGGILMLWVGIRVVSWSSPFAIESSRTGSAALDSASPTGPDARRDLAVDSSKPPAGLEEAIAQPSPVQPASFLAGGRHFDIKPRSFLFAAPALQTKISPAYRQDPVDRRITAPSPQSPAVQARETAAPAAPAAALLVTKGGQVKRWRLDAWAMLRQGSGQAVQPLGAARAPSYGASQMGVVARRTIGPSRANAPFVFARANKALQTQDAGEVALGVGGRPVSAFPLAAYAEMRLGESGGAFSVRPAAFVVTEIPRQKLPHKIEAEIYAQAGYVGGEFSTPFIDAQARIERKVATIGPVSFSAGAGAWVGAQQGASRADVGPSASARMQLDKVPIRVSVDYRVRAVGNAEPGSGLAVTLSSGF